MKHILPIFLAFVSSASAALLEERQQPAAIPQPDECLFALKVKHQYGRVDCGDYLRVTVTPATVTVRQTKPFGRTRTSNSIVELEGTTTTTFTPTNTITVTETSSTTEVVVIPITEYVTAQVEMLKKRQETSLPGTFPSYASACTDFAQYSSACSRIGVTGSTKKLWAPRKTITVRPPIPTFIATVVKTISVTVEAVTITETAPTVEVTVTETSLEVATRTENGETVTQTVPAQCLNLEADPIKYGPIQRLVLVGASLDRTPAVSNGQECCYQCYNDPLCFGFSYGNYDPSLIDTPTLTPENVCYIHYIFGDKCSEFQPYMGLRGGEVPEGGVSHFGYGRCRVPPWPPVF